MHDLQKCVVYDLLTYTLGLLCLIIQPSAVLQCAYIIIPFPTNLVLQNMQVTKYYYLALKNIMLSRSQALLKICDNCIDIQTSN